MGGCVGCNAVLIVRRTGGGEGDLDMFPLGNIVIEVLGAVDVCLLADVRRLHAVVLLIELDVRNASIQAESCVTATSHSYMVD